MPYQGGYLLVRVEGVAIFGGEKHDVTGKQLPIRKVPFVAGFLAEKGTFKIAVHAPIIGHVVRAVQQDGRLFAKFARDLGWTFKRIEAHPVDGWTSAEYHLIHETGGVT